MGGSLGVRKKSSGRRKNEPLKVVYISNPMRVHTSASEFKALVQQLTGRDAEFPDPPANLCPTSNLNPHGKQHPRDDDQEVAQSTNHFLTSLYESLEDILSDPHIPAHL